MRGCLLSLLMLLGCVGWTLLPVHQAPAEDDAAAEDSDDLFGEDSDAAEEAAEENADPDGDAAAAEEEADEAMEDEPADDAPAEDNNPNDADIEDEAMPDEEATEEPATEDDATESPPAELPDTATKEETPKRVLAKDPPGMNRLNPESNAWIDPKFKRVVVDGEVCLREGQLEMFACLKGTKEHESVVAVDCKAMLLHAALLAVGAQAGTPVQFQPVYKPATGTVIDIGLVWTDADGVHRAKAQDWVKNHKTGEVMKEDWVFAGSGFYVDEETGEKHYKAEGGDLICVSNFPSAMLDVPVKSSQSNDQLLFVPNTDAIPPKGTKVRMVLTPRLEPAKAPADASAGQ